MFKVNMGLRNDEKVLVVTDVPRINDWINIDSSFLRSFVIRCLLAKAVYEIACEAFPNNYIEFYVYPCTGRHGAEPGEEVAKKLREFDVVIALTTYSLSHTKAREDATKAGARIASMPGFLPEMFYPGGPMSVDYMEVKVESEKLAELLTKASEARVISPGGTDISFSLKGRVGEADTGLYIERGEWGNLPAGEAYIAPVEGTANGKLVVEKGWYPGLTENMTFVFRDGDVVEVSGGGKIGDYFRETLKPDVNEEPYKSRRNLAELGIGTNPNAKRPDNVLEAEKIKGTVHIAVGDNSHIGGVVSTDLHEDFIIPKPTLYLGNKLIMKDGKLLI